MNATRRLFLFLTLWLIAIVPSAAQETGYSVMERVMEANRAPTSALDIRLTLIDGDGNERERRLQTLTRTDGELTLTLTVFLAPASVENTRFLTVEKEGGGTDQWIFLPALGRSKRISAQQGGGSFMGSDFSYDDMGSTTYDPDQAEHLLVGQETVGGKLCHVVESRPTGDSDYAKTVTWVDRETFLPLKVEFYDTLASAPRKVMEASDQYRADGRWVSGTLLMTDRERNHSTRIEILQAKYGIPIDERYFTVAFLENGRIL